MNKLLIGSFPSLIIFTILLIDNSECSFVEKITSEVLKKLFECLDNSLSNDSRAKCDENLAYGVNVAAGQLKSVFKFLEPKNSSLFGNVQVLHKLAVGVLEKLKMNCESTFFHKSVTSPIWESDMNPQRLFPTSQDFELFYEREVSRIRTLPEGELLLSGHPNENESNNCLIKLNNNCAIDRKCLEKEVTSGNAGYSLTHQIIYWQNFRQMKCSEKYDGLIKNIIRKKCQRVYAQQVYLTRHYNLDANILDLLTEQVAVCGMEGFEEFLDKDVRKMIIDNQMTCGCYNFSVNSSYFEELQSTCMYDAHLTSVAALALSVHLKYEVLF